MTDALHILADGFPTPLLFAGAAIALWALGKIFSGSAPAERTGARTTGTTFDPNDLRQIRDRIRQKQSPRPTAATKNKSRGKPRQTKPAAPPPLPVQPVSAARPAMTVAPAMTLSEAPPPAAETARNVRLLLQPASLREAVLLNEILGKPKALQDG